MKKKILIVLAFVLSVVCLFGTSGCFLFGGGTLGEFKGKLSEETYQSEDEAAEAFLKNEVCGNTTDATFVSYEKQSDLTEDELNSLNLTADEKKEVTSAEKGVVKYVERAKARDISVEVSSSTMSQNLYIIKLGAHYKYFVPALTTGETLTKSYFESVFDVERYKNCTLVSHTLTEGTESNALGQSTSVKVEMDYTYEITETALALTLSMKYYTDGTLDSTKSGEASLYVLQTDNGLKGYAVSGSQYAEVSLSDLGLNFESLDEVFAANLPDFIDQTYFVMTDTGFKIRDDRMKEYAENQFADKISGVLVSYDFEVDTSYIVNNGTLEKGTAACTINGTSIYGTTVVASASSECTYSKFGSTRVNVPASIKALA